MRTNNQSTAIITPDRLLFYIGCFDKKEDGAKAYDKKAIELFGEFAYLNFEETKWKAS